MAASWIVYRSVSSPRAIFSSCACAFVSRSRCCFRNPLLIDDNGTAVSPLRYALGDVSDDGLLDLTLKFGMPEMIDCNALGPDSIAGLLTGALFDGTRIEGTDSIRIVPPNGSNGNSLQVSAVPEPSALTLAAYALLGVIDFIRRGDRSVL